MRPDPDTFNPLALVDPNEAAGFLGFLERVSDTSGMGPKVEKAKPSEPPPEMTLGPAAWCAVPVIIYPPPTWFSRMVDWFESIETPNDRRKRLERKRFPEAVVWGLWAGFYWGASGADENILNDWLAASAYAANPHGIDIAFWGEVIVSADASRLVPPPPWDMRPESEKIFRDPPLGPALGPAALFKHLFLRAHPYRNHLLQVLRAAPWDPASGSAERLATVAPCLPGILAGGVFADMAFNLSNDCWDIDGAWTPKDPARAWVEKMVLNGGSIEKSVRDEKEAERDKERCLRTLENQRIWRRHRPLRPPFSCEDLLHVALWANLDATSFEDVMKAVRELGGDATACAAAGALAGGRFGMKSLPAATLNGLPARDRIAEMAQRYAEFRRI